MGRLRCPGVNSNMITRIILTTLTLFTGLVAACSISTGSGPAPSESLGLIPEPTQSEIPGLAGTLSAQENPPLELSEAFVGLTHQQLDGNRLVLGSGGMPTEPTDVPLRGVPLWVVGTPFRGGSLWVVALESGFVQAFHVTGGAATEVGLNRSTLPTGMPPTLWTGLSQAIILPPLADASIHTFPIPLPSGGQAYLDDQGQMRFAREAQAYSMAAHALPDARILADGSGRLLFLSAPSGAYPHAVLGDALEATAITLVKVAGEPSIERVIHVEAGDVIEGIAPMWVDLDRDGTREVIVTQSNAQTGARLVVYRESGDILTEAEPIGRGFRWRHQIAAGQFLPGGLLEIAVVRTPHIGGVLELYVLEGGQLEIEAQLAGFSSHRMGSRNLDAALAGDLDGDGIIEVVLPDQAQRNLAGVQMGSDGLTAVWEVPLEGSLSTNLAAVSLPGEGVALAAGIDTGLLRLWLTP
jgi:hypothetical protein